MRTFIRILRSSGSPRTAILSAFVLCGMYFASWYIISRYCNAGSIVF